MIEKALKGSNVYIGWLVFLSVLILAGVVSYAQQYQYGLGYTGMSRDVSWGIYISQFTFLVGVAAGGVMIVLPYYVHNFKDFGRITILGEFLAIASVAMCLLFIMADLGQPTRALNVLLHPTPNSMLFWDMIVLNGYLFLNILVGWVVLHSEYKGTKYPKWLKPFIWLSLPWAISIHTVTAMLYCGLPGRHFWLTAIIAPRFLASAFAAGPSLLLFIALVLKRVTKFDLGDVARDKIITIIGYAAILNFFFLGLEFFVAYYSDIPGHKHALDYLFWGLEGHDNLVGFMRLSLVLGGLGLALFWIPQTRSNEKTVMAACVLVFSSLWIDKGLGFVLGGFVPTPLEYVTEYYPTFGEILITMGVWSTGFLILTILYKVAISVKLEKES